MFKGRRESNGAVIKQAADLNAGVDTGTFFARHPSDCDRCEYRRDRPSPYRTHGLRFAGIIGDLRHDRCVAENMHFFSKNKNSCTSPSEKMQEYQRLKIYLQAI